ncbi:uncharacterized protein AMSG_06814 [Thecamonas trahens ATCC 50062]|uniref:Exportin-4 n=1 Tax=Thecamonas trahens ATCC 50062 TaxID=461836 RepID=A0A0L0DDV9_THETB|nr:hypothetical protein AMSG_06814 [Thecamonas trahens ATCC 50062]KNC50331.1 hypothetical protein AMSG_06814 [Thecamonas trahens ATCC 50062]|eukprot:XP_013756877.1 hypothetical protein AMSG_06814 [Thecamonas trahens ATCC 50062]
MLEAEDQNGWLSLPLDFVRRLAPDRSAKLSSSARRQAIVLLAAVLKCGWLDASDELCISRISVLTEPLHAASGSPEDELHLEILVHVVEQFSPRHDTTRIGLPVEAHLATAATFQNLALPRIFHAAGCLLDLILEWNFDLPSIAAAPGSSRALQTSSSSCPLLPPQEWWEVILCDPFITAIFALYRRCADASPATHLRNLILRLSSLDVARMVADAGSDVLAFAGHIDALLLAHIFEILARSGPEPEVLAMAEAISNVVVHGTWATLTAAPDAEATLASMCELTRSLLVAASGDDLDDEWLFEAYDHLHVAWVHMATSTDYSDAAPYLASSLEAFDADAALALDRVVDQMRGHGLLARLALGTNLAALRDCIDSALGSLLSAPHASEALRWSLYMLAFVLCDVPEECSLPIVAPAPLAATVDLTSPSGSSPASARLSSDVPLIPDAVIAVSSGYDEEPDSDPVLGVAFAVLGLLTQPELLARLPLSTSRAILAFVGIWARTYVLPQRQDYAALPSHFAAALSSSSLVESLVSAVVLQLELCGSAWRVQREKLGLAAAASHMLSSVMDSRPLARVALAAPSLPALYTAYRAVCDEHPSLDLAPDAAATSVAFHYHMHYALGAMLEGGVDRSDLIQPAFDQICTPLVARTLATLEPPLNLRNLEPVTSSLLTEHLASLRGILSVSVPVTATPLAGLLTGSDLGGRLVDLLGAALAAIASLGDDASPPAADVYAAIATDVVAVFGAAAAAQLPHLDLDASSDLCATVFHVVELAAQFCAAASELRAASDVLPELLALVLGLVHSVGLKDMFDFGGSGESLTDLVCAFVMQALASLLPVIEPKHIRIPGLAAAVFGLLEFASSRWPAAVVELDPPIFAAFNAIATYGLYDAHQPLQAKLALDVLSNVLFYHGSQLAAGREPHLGRHIDANPELLTSHLLSLLQATLLDEFDMNLLPAASSVLFALICTISSEFEELALSLVSSVAKPHLQQRLIDALHSLGDAITPRFERAHRRTFAAAFKTFVYDVRPFLCIK